MRFALRLTAAAVASLAGITGIVLLAWPGWIAAMKADGWLLPWESGAWSLLLVDAAGQASAATLQPILLAAITLLLAITLVSTFLSVMAPEPAAPVAALPQPPAHEHSAEINAELATVAALLRSHLEANGLYQTVLARANAQLPSLASPEQIRMIVSYLMVENENMRGKTTGLQGNLELSRRQIDRLKANLAAARAEGVNDGLTRLMNRRGFDLALASAVAEARDSVQPLSLVMTDIDHFKMVNDRLGHPAGDDVLKWFAHILGTNMKGRDTVARYGGEEFAIILPHTRLEDAANLAGQIKTQLAESVWQMPSPPHTKVRITASFGVAEFTNSEGTGSLLKRADAKLYEAKQTGRNRVMG